MSLMIMGNVYPQNLLAGVPAHFPGGSYFRIMSLSAAAAVDVRFYKNGSEVGKAEGALSGFWSEAQDGETFDKVTVTSATAQTVKVAVANGRVGVDSNTASIEQGTAITDAAPVAVGVAATALIAAGSGRKSLRFKNDGAVTVYLGGAGVTVANSPAQIAPGQTWVEDDAADAAWYGISGTAGQSVRVQAVS